MFRTGSDRRYQQALPTPRTTTSAKNGSEFPSGDSTMNLTAYQQDVLQEVVNIGVGRAAGVLDEMLCTHIRLQIPCIKILLPDQLKDKLEERLDGERVSAVGLGFRGSF